MADDAGPGTLAAIARELYGLAPEEFIAARKAQIAAAREAGDRTLAQRIGELRKPTVAAWLVNQLVREHRDEIDVLLDLGEEMRAGLAGLSGDEMRALTRRRLQLVDALVRLAAQLAAGHGRTAGADALGSVKASLDSTLADPERAAAVREGCLAEPLELSAFGFGSLPPTDEVEAEPAAGSGATVADLDAHRARRDQQRREAESEVEQAASETETARAAFEEAQARAADARAQQADAAAAVAEVEKRLVEARRELERRTSKAEKWEQQESEAAEALEDAEDLLAEAREHLSRLTTR